MSVEPLEIQMTRLQEQLKAVVVTLSEDREIRRESDKSLASIAVSVTNLDRRLETVERQLVKNEPTIEEFIVIKNQVQGAGKLGKWIWFAGGILIAGIYNIREAIRAMFL